MNKETGKFQTVLYATKIKMICDGREGFFYMVGLILRTTLSISIRNLNGKKRPKNWNFTWRHS